MIIIMYTDVHLALAANTAPSAQTGLTEAHH